MITILATAILFLLVMVFAVHYWRFTLWLLALFSVVILAILK